MKQFLFVYLLFHIFLTSQAQKLTSFDSGFIVTNSNDTVYGEIKQTPYSVFSSVISFQDQTSHVFKSLSPSDIRSFCLSPGTTFEAIEISSSQEGRAIKQKYFALRMIAGELDYLVLYLPDEIEKYYIRSKEFGLAELQKTSEERERIERLKTVSELVIYRQYLFTLGKYMYKIPSFRNQIEKCPFSSKGFYTLIADYNSKIGGKNVITPIHKSKLKWDVSAQAGYDNYFIGELISAKEHNGYYGFMVGLSNSFYFGQKFRETELVVDLNYHRNEKEYTTSQIEVPLYLKYNNKFRRISPICEIGICTRYLLESPHIFTYSFEPPVKFDKVGMDYILGLGLGINFKRMNFKYVFYSSYRNALVMDIKLK